MQSSYSINSDAAFAGMIADGGSDRFVESGVARTTMPFGRAVGNDPADVKAVHLALRDKGTLTFDGDFQASDVIIVTINGVACATVNFTSTHANTATLVLAAIAAHASVTASSKSANGRVFTVETSGEVISLATTGSSINATGVANYVTPQDDVFRGVTVHRNKETTYYVADEVVDILRKGRIWVETSEAVEADDDAYVDMSAGLGKFCDTSTNNLATGGKFRSTVTTAGLAVLEINLP